MYREIGQYTTIQCNISFFQAVDQTAVADAVGARLGVDAGNPEGAKLTLALPAIAVGVLPGLGNSLLGNPEYTTACSNPWPASEFSCDDDAPPLHVLHEA